MDDFDDELGRRLLRRWLQFSSDIQLLLQSASHSLGEAVLPDTPGVYILVDDELNECYVGKATRSLRDRVLSKHVSGDESHAMQRAYKNQYLDRLERRRFIKENIRVKWLTESDPVRIADLERLLIWLLQTRCNRG